MGMTKSESELKKQALDALEKEENWSWAQWKAVAVAGSGFLTDSYDNFIISLVVPMIGYTYYPKLNGHVPAFESGWLKAASSYGNLVGQLLFGFLGDIIGRKKLYGIALIILIVGALGGSLAAQPAHGLSIISILAIWRFILGVGVGGDYPVSSVITSEFATTRNRGALIATVFSMQGIGILLACGVSVAAVAFMGKEAIEADPTNLDYVWRFCVGFGAFPALCAVYYRFTIQESPRFTMNVEGNVEQAASDAQHISELHSVEVVGHKKPQSAARAYSGRFFKHFSQWKHLRVLIGCAMCWFLLDIGYYGTNLNTPVVLTAIGFADDTHGAYWNVWLSCIGNLIIALCGNVPGYYFTVAFVDRWGRKPIQMMGFTMLTICFAIMGLDYTNLTQNHKTLFVVIYSIAQFFFNFGPNATTFIFPAEVFPTAVRSSAHGISAASGKLGAIIAAQLFSTVTDLGGPPGKATFMYGVLLIFSAVCFLGLLFTFLLPETMGKSLEELNDEEELQ